MQEVVQGSGRALFQPARVSYRVEGCEWVSVESDCQRETDKKQTGEDKYTCTLTEGKTAVLMISADQASEKGRKKTTFLLSVFAPR